jgi:hypothetical protein
MTVMAMRQLARQPDVLDVVEAAAALADRWPVGTTVRHESGWTGEVVEADAPDFPTLIHFRGYAVLGWQGGKPIWALAVEWQVDGRPAVAWYRPRVLRRVRGAAR